MLRTQLTETFVWLKEGTRDFSVGQAKRDRGILKMTPTVIKFSKSELVEYCSLLGIYQKCTTCKRKKTNVEVFTFGDKTCDACCLTKRKRRTRVRKSANVLKRVNLHETKRTCSSCKCVRPDGKFADATKKTCSMCLEKRRVKRLKQLKL